MKKIIGLVSLDLLAQGKVEGNDHTRLALRTRSLPGAIDLSRQKREIGSVYKGSRTYH